MKIDVLTLFPGMFGGPLSESILRIAREKGLLDVRLWDVRDFTGDRHRSADDRPYGGGAGMVLKVEPLVRCAEHVLRERGEDAHRVLLTPRGRTFSQAVAREFAEKEHLLLICGHYEGIDERVRICLDPDEVSIGDYVLSGGELAALAIVDAVARLTPGVLGSPESLLEESFTGDLAAEYPQYTRPPEFRGLAVPEVLRSGHHERIRAWREEMARRGGTERRQRERDDEEV
jgi:tRNA (guanine37-N1)-methyltransferase